MTISRTIPLRFPLSSLYFLSSELEPELSVVAILAVAAAEFAQHGERLAIRFSLRAQPLMKVQRRKTGP